MKAIAVAFSDGPSTAIIFAPIINSSPEKTTIGGEKTLRIGTCMARMVDGRNCDNLMFQKCRRGIFLVTSVHMSC